MKELESWMSVSVGDVLFSVPGYSLRTMLVIRDLSANSLYFEYLLTLDDGSTRCMRYLREDISYLNTHIWFVPP